ncbi:unnamed protein product [Haemonchus placei]|uniref:Uncharacterized protein n=1 Tax=Haemonchus placei TaxID=6290 RepID=A0A0N4W2E2_HAEPC|nr:unnamed protein product [Haemonchus placei]
MPIAFVLKKLCEKIARNFHVDNSILSSDSEEEANSKYRLNKRIFDVISINLACIPEKERASATKIKYWTSSGKHKRPLTDSVATRI